MYSGFTCVKEYMLNPSFLNQLHVIKWNGDMYD